MDKGDYVAADKLKDTSTIYQKLKQIRSKLSEIKNQREYLQSKCEHEIILYFGIVKGMDSREDFELYRCPLCNKEMNGIEKDDPRIADLSNLRRTIATLEYPVLGTYQNAQDNMGHKIEREIFPYIMHLCQHEGFLLTYENIRKSLEITFGVGDKVKIKQKND